MPGGLVGAVGRVSLGRIPMRRGGVQKALELLHVGFVHVRLCGQEMQSAAQCVMPLPAESPPISVPESFFSASGIGRPAARGGLDPQWRVAADRLGNLLDWLVLALVRHLRDFRLPLRLGDCRGYRIGAADLGGFGEPL